MYYTTNHHQLNSEWRPWVITLVGPCLLSVCHRLHIYNQRALAALCAPRTVCCAPLLTSHRSSSDTVCASAKVPFRFSRVTVTVPLESFEKFYHNLPGHSYFIADDDAPVHRFPLYMKYVRNFYLPNKFAIR